MLKCKKKICMLLSVFCLIGLAQPAMATEITEGTTTEITEGINTERVIEENLENKDVLNAKNIIDNILSSEYEIMKNWSSKPNYQNIDNNLLKYLNKNNEFKSE